jgi:hypothetical protein
MIRKTIPEVLTAGIEAEKLDFVFSDGSSLGNAAATASE